LQLIKLYLLFSCVLLLTFIVYKLSGHKYSLDLPDARKHHERAVPQIGGIVFGSLFLFLTWWSDLAPQWYLVGGGVSILLGAIDDNFNLSWPVKLFVQLILAIYLTYLFWGKFSHLSFYGYEIAVSQPILLILFLFWFVGIYNAVNLIDGLDGLDRQFFRVY